VGRITAAVVAILAAAGGAALWTFVRQREPLPVPAPAADINLRMIAASPERLTFGLDRTPRELTLRSFSGHGIDWFVRTGSRFEITPSSGTIEPFGAAVLRVKPSSSLTAGLNAEHTWFNWRATSSAAGHVMVVLTAIRVPEIEYQLSGAGAGITLTVNGAAVAGVRQTTAWVALPVSDALRAGGNQLEAQGSRFKLMLRAGSEETTMSEANPIVTIVVDRDFGFITFSPRLPAAASTRSP
jgi:hypothetical protein